MSASGPFTALLWADVPEARRGALSREAALEDVLRELLEKGRSAWPTVTLAPETFLRHLARHLPSGDAPLEALRQLHAAELYLTCACAAGEPQALALLESHYLRKVPARIGRLAPLDEVLQLMRQRLLLGVAGSPPKIGEYSGRGELEGWLRIVAVRIARQLASRDGRQELFSEPPEELTRMLAPDDPERDVLRADSREALTASLQAALAALSERERTLLRLHHLHGLTMDRLATMYGEHRSSVARHVVQARERLLKLTRRELAARLKLEGRELESLLGLVQSRLELSLHRLME